MKKRILSVLLCLCMVMACLPTTALAAGTGITVTNVTYYNSGALHTISGSFYWGSASAKTRLVLMKEQLRSTVSGYDTYGDFTDNGYYFNKNFYRFEDVLAYDQDLDGGTAGVFGIRAKTEECSVNIGSNNNFTFTFEESDIPLSTNAIYYVYLWTYYNSRYYPDHLICAIQVQDGAVRYASATGSGVAFTTGAERNAYDSSGFANVVSASEYKVTVIPGAYMTKVDGSGELSQNGLTTAMTPVVYTAYTGYYFPEGYSVATVNGIMVRRDSQSQITVYGTPSANATITLQPCTPIVHSSHPLCGASCSHSSDTHSNATWTGVSTLTNEMAAGHYYLTGDVTLSTTWEPQNNIALCLNGHTIKADGDFDAIKVESSKTFTLTDCKTGNEQGRITHEVGKNGRGVYITGTFNMYGGIITGNRAEIESNKNGGGVYSSGTFNMYGGSITGNTASGNGGGVYATSAATAFTMTGGRITGNSADNGGGVYKYRGTFNMTGGDITGNEATKNGGGVYNYLENTDFEMSGGSITNNTATQYGGGVFNGNGTFTVSGSVNVSGNTNGTGTGAQANNVHLGSTVITIGGTLTNTTPIGVTMDNPGVFTSGWNDNMPSADPATHFASDSASYTVALKNNELNLESVQGATYTVTFQGGEGALGTPPQQTAAAVGDTFALPANTFTKTGYTFAGWNDGTRTYQAGNTYTMPERNVTFTAQWTYINDIDNDDDDDDYTPSYKVETSVSKDTDGTISSDHRTAEAGDKVTIKVSPDRYYKVDDVVIKDQNGKVIPVTDNKDGTFTFKMPSSKVTVDPIFSWDNPFADVAENAYYAPAVEWALKNDVTGGTTATTFSPNAVCTRAQAVTFLWRAAGCPEPAGTNSFTDVSADAYYAKAVAWAVEQGITNGTGGGKFSPDAACTRAQVVAFLWRAEGSDAAGTANSFADVPANAYYTDAVNWAVENSITGGTSATTFSPAVNCTRAQIVTFLYRDMVE